MIMETLEFPQVLSETWTLWTWHFETPRKATIVHVFKAYYSYGDGLTVLVVAILNLDRIGKFILH